MKNRLRELIILLAIACLLPAGLTGQIRTLDNGDQISWDGEYYDFRDADGVKMIKLWIPPDVRPVRGVFISGHGGGSGDSRNFARDENLRAFAMRLGFAVAGLHNFPGRRVYTDGAPVFFEALTHFSEMGDHPELANIPFVMYGSSNGGSATYGFVNYAPERAICFLSNVGAGSNPEQPVPAALEVPGIFIMGKFDALIRQRGIDRTRSLLNDARPKGARWAWALELKGHEDGVSFDVYMKFVEQAVAARYPESVDPSSGPVRLKTIKERDGWLVDQESWDTGLTYVDSYANYSGDKTKAGWVLNKDMAYVYRSLATHYNPLEISVKEFDRTYNPNTDPGTMFSLGGPVIDPGKKITIQCDTDRFPDWKKLEFFDGADKLGEVNRGAEPEIRVSVDGDRQVYCLEAVATAGDGTRVTSPPMHFFVRNPSLSWIFKKEEPVYTGRKPEGAPPIPDDLNFTAPDPSDSILLAYGLTADMEQQFSSSDGKLSPFWTQIDAGKDRIEMTQRRNAASGAAFNFVLTHDCNMTVKAAYGHAGVYLLFEINDDNDVAWPNAYTGTEKEQFYLEFDAVDVLMDSRSVASISDEQNRDMFLSRSFGLTFTTRQYQVACGTPKERPTGFKRAIPDPWDFHSTFYTFDQAKRVFGSEIENIKTGPFHKAQEWFIPWSAYGAGLEETPAAGARFGFSAGYNDRDEGEHFPPGKTSSGGTVKASNALRWRNRSDPWGSDKPPYNWGEIELGPML